MSIAPVHISIDAAAAQLGLSPTHLAHVIAAGSLRTRVLGGRQLLAVSDVDRYASRTRRAEIETWMMWARGAEADEEWQVLDEMFRS